MPPPSDDFPDELEAVKRASVAQLLIRCGRLVNEQGLERAREQFGVPIRASHTSLFPHLDLEGTRLTALARRMGVSKQAASQLVVELETMGVLMRVPDPADGRAKLIRFTQEGQRSLMAGLAVLQRIDGELEERIGTRRMRALHSGLLALLDTLEPS